MWTQRLEKTAIASAILSLFANIGVRSSFNTTVATFAIYAAYTRNGRVNAVSALLVAVSILIDIVLFGLYGQQWGNLGHEYVFGLIMAIFNLFAKVVLLVIHYNLFVEFGGMFGGACVRAAAFDLQNHPFPSNTNALEVCRHIPPETFRCTFCVIFTCSLVPGG